MASGDLTLSLCIHGMTSCICSIYPMHKNHTYNLSTLYSIHTLTSGDLTLRVCIHGIGHVYILYTLYVQMTHIYSSYAVYILRRFPPQMHCNTLQHPLIPPNRKTQIPRCLAVQFNVRFLCNLNLH